MPIFSVNGIGKYGIYSNLPGAEIPPEAWTSAKNMRFNGEAAQKMRGGSAILPGAPIAAYALFPYTGVTGNPGWILCGDNKIYAVEGGTYYNITRQTTGVDVDYTAEPQVRWTGGIFNGKAVLYNGLDVPQYWSLDVANRLVPLAGWPAATSAKFIRAFKNFLVAGSVTKSGTSYYNLIKWSHAADPGFMPTSWDETDPTKDAGEYALAETPGNVVDFATLKDTGIIYKDDSIWMMQLIGGVAVMKFQKISTMAGLVAKDCITEYEIGKHLMFTGDDLVIHDGVQVKSILGRFNRNIIGDIDPTNLLNAFIFNVQKFKEAWFCYATTGMAPGVVDKAIIWNYETGAFQKRDLGQYTAFGYGSVNTGGVSDITWDGDVDSWDTEPASWTGGVFTGSYGAKELLGQRVGGTLLVEEQQYGVDGVPFTAELERLDIGIPFSTQRPPDVSSMKFLRRVWPRIEGNVGDVIEVTIGSAMVLGGSVTWQAPQSFVVGTTEWLDCMVSGRVFALRFKTTTLASWRLFGYDLEVDRVGSH